MTNQPPKPKLTLSHRIAEPSDVPAIINLMQESIAENMKAYLSAQEIEAAKETMGVDSSLIADGTYFLIEAMVEGETVLVGCGGWGKRKTLFGGDHTVGRDDSLSDPATDAARIRAMYTHPGFTRQGIGSLLLQLGESEASAAGFKRIQLGSTLAGEPLYRAAGYVELKRENIKGANGSDSYIITMEKPL